MGARLAAGTLYQGGLILLTFRLQRRFSGLKFWVSPQMYIRGRCKRLHIAGIGKWKRHLAPAVGM